MSDQEKPKKKKLNLKGLWWKIPLVIIGLIGMINAMSNVNSREGLPKCGSSNAKDTLSQAFDNSQFAKNMNLNAIEITGSKELNGSTKKQRNCTANITLNNSKTVSALFKLMARDNGNYMLEFEIQE